MTTIACLPHLAQRHTPVSHLVPIPQQRFQNHQRGLSFRPSFRHVQDGNASFFHLPFHGLDDKQRILGCQSPIITVAVTQYVVAYW